MPAPTLASGGTGIIIQTGAANVAILSGGVVGDYLLLTILQDGVTGSPTLAAGSLGTVENLAGTDNTMTSDAGGGGDVQCGATNLARLRCYHGRIASLSGGLCNINVTTPGDDLYCRMWLFTNVNSGSNPSDVWENGTAGADTEVQGTSAAITDAAVTTLGSGRLAINVVGVNDDNNLAAMTGMTGGTWVYAGGVISATGTDGACGLFYADMPSAGTIDGGSFTMAASDAWGMAGFALKPFPSLSPGVNDRRTPRRRMMQRI